MLSTSYKKQTSCHGPGQRLQAYGDQHGDPLEWLGKYLEEDRKLLSREEALRRLGG
jgi:hypothetical protein